MLAGRIMTADHKEFILGEWDGINRSGWQALDDNVIVLMEEHVDKTSGGILIPDETRERQTLSSEHGILISLGPAAFSFNNDASRKWVGRAPQAGDRVAVERYAGTLINGADGQKYRLMSQRCVGAVAIGVEPSPDGVSLMSTAHPKGPGVGRGHRIKKSSLEIVEIDLPEIEEANR